MGDPAFPGVRVAWWYGEATETVAIVPFESDGSFDTSASVPADAPASAARVCVAHDGTERTRFVCTPFTVDVPPPGHVRGQIALSDPSQPVDASLTLYDLEGTAVATASIQADGSFLSPDVPPGTYEASFEGTLADVIATQDVAVQPGAEYLLTPDKITVPCTVAHAGAVTNIMVTAGGENQHVKGTYPVQDLWHLPVAGRERLRGDGGLYAYHPDHARLVLKNRRHDATAQAVWVVGKVTIMTEFSRSRSELVDPAELYSRPEHAGPVLVNG